MDFKIRPSGWLFVRVLLIVSLVVMVCVDFFLPMAKSGLLHYNYVFYSFMALAYTEQSYRELYFTFSNKPIFSIDERRIYDHYNDVVYNWGDIEAIRQENGYLYLKLYHPEDYLNKIGNWHYRMLKKLWYKPGGKHNEFSINLSLADAARSELSTLVNIYSLMQNIK